MSIFEILILSAMILVFCAFALVLAYAQRQTENVMAAKGKTAVKEKTVAKSSRAPRGAPATSKIAA